jgi:hypothetical protein
MRRKGWK